jgi:uncharacterized low-complexity protein
MSQHKKTLKPLSLAIGATFAASMAAGSIAHAASTGDNPFAMHDLSSGYTQLAEMPKDGKCGEGKCSSDKKKSDKKANEGKCGEGKAMPKEGKCGDKQPKAKEGKCGGQ